ncbi:hypothetical protein [Aureliella helgolandensis]|uniref:Polymerase nucleotidyl transferase domain-containing protein n=1 Tax=Aureliella helgolandensis TaxID=2527968 RepID=A0A518G063_9BACT|nr:hypothetical protein [Aureliella helgolandensis]QDV21998.1 hypothetical protein Q31a_02770 [Aureliella helgolandensis]
MQTVESSLRQRWGYLAKDFVETADGQLFAVVVHGVEAGRVLTSLRYTRRSEGLRKLGSLESQQLLQKQHPDWLYHCPRRDVQLHGVPESCVIRHYRPAAFLEEQRQLYRAAHHPTLAPALKAIRQHLDAGNLETGQLEAGQLAAGQLAAGHPQTGPTGGGLTGEWGITGSHLLGAAGADSDIDCVVYGMKNFLRAQQLAQNAMERGDWQGLTPEQWQAAYQRRGCELSLAEYSWHERRKYNKFSVMGTKIDLSCVDNPPPEALIAGEKIGKTQLLAQVVDDTHAFASPAVYRVSHPRIQSVLSGTPTYAGQAVVGEWIQARGWEEHTLDGSRRLVVGTSREGSDEWLKVVSAPAVDGKVGNREEDAVFRSESG